MAHSLQYPRTMSNAIRIELDSISGGTYLLVTPRTAGWQNRVRGWIRSHRPVVGAEYRLYSITRCIVGPAHCHTV